MRRAGWLLYLYWGGHLEQRPPSFKVTCQRFNSRPLYLLLDGKYTRPAVGKSIHPSASHPFHAVASASSRSRIGTKPRGSWPVSVHLCKPEPREKFDFWDNFFRPSPPRLSPGRNTVFVPLNELCKVLYVPSLGSQKRARTSTRSIQSNLGCKPKSETRSPKNKQDKTKNTQKTKTKHKNHPAVMDVLLARRAAYVPMNWEDELDLAKSKNTTNQTSQQDRGEGAKTKADQQCRNPGSPQPGSRRSHREAHGAQGTFNRMRRPCSELGCRPAAGTLPW